MKETYIQPQTFVDSETGCLQVVEFENLPFQPQRAYWITNFVTDSERGYHAHKELSQIFFVLRGEVRLEISTPESKFEVNLDQESGGFQLKPGFWRVIKNQRVDSVLLVFADLPFDETDYIRDWNSYKNWFRSEMKID